MDIQSSPGKGTSVMLTIPYWPVNERTRSLHAEALLSPQSASVGSSRPAAGSSSAALRVLLVDDHVMVREGLRSLLEGRNDVQVVGEAGDGLAGIEMAATLNPDVVVMDVTMPRIDGIEATRRIKHDHPSIAVVGLSVDGASHIETAMKAAGASIFVSKDAAGDELYEAIITAGVGKVRG